MLVVLKKLITFRCKYRLTWVRPKLLNSCSIGSYVMAYIRSYKTSMEVFILTDRFQNNVELSTNVCNV